MLDADIYGPSLPKLLAIKERPQTLGGTRLKPITRYGLTVMSIGFLIDEETPMIWRGPMVISALTQMLREVEWGTLDVMVVDMPPGTGDAQLTMAQQVPLKGAVIVSTPQDLALIDARRGIAMFKRVNVPVLGIVENMSYFLCPECGDALRHFRPRRRAPRGRAARRAVPRRGAAAHDDPREVGCRPAGGRDRARTGRMRRSIATIAARVRDQLKGRAAGRAAPKIVIEAVRLIQSSTHIRIRLASDFETRSNSALLPSRANICRRAVSRSNSNSRRAGSRTKLRAQPTAASRAPRVTSATRWSDVDG